MKTIDFLPKKVTAKTNCFSYDAAKNRCHVCKELLCEKGRGRCSFYKTDASLAAARAESANKLKMMKKQDKELNERLISYGMDDKELDILSEPGTN